MKKKKGSYISTLVVVFLIMVPIVAIVGTYLNSNKDSVVISKIDKVVNEYMLRMESVGYLDSLNEDSIISELNAIGIENVSLNGSTKVKGSYGDRIYLKVKGEYSMKALEIKDDLSMVNNEELIPIDLTYTSINKS